MTTLDGNHDVTEKNEYAIVDSGQVSDRPVDFGLFSPDDA